MCPESHEPVIVKGVLTIRPDKIKFFPEGDEMMFGTEYHSVAEMDRDGLAGIGPPVDLGPATDADPVPWITDVYTEWGLDHGQEYDQDCCVEEV